jgi:hypothetical protein
MNMGIKQDYIPLVPSEPHQVGISPPKETRHGSIPWSNTFIDENMTIDLIMNAMMLAKTVLHIFQQGCGEGTPSFEAPNQTIKNISKRYGCHNKEILNTKMERTRGKTPKNEGHC